MMQMTGMLGMRGYMLLELHVPKNNICDICGPRQTKFKASFFADFE